MKLINKRVQVTFDKVNSEFTVSYATDQDGTVWSKNAKTVGDVLYLIGQITKTKISFSEM